MQFEWWDMLEPLKGKCLVFVGDDSLNRNMCQTILRNLVKDKSIVFEASGKQEF